MPVPILQIRRTNGPAKDISVAATWPDGRFEEIKGFKNETDANEWIAKEFDRWLADHGDGKTNAARS